MRDIIKKILKESEEQFENVIYLIVSNDGQMALTNPVFFSGQALWFPISVFKDKFYKLGYEIQQAEAMLNIQPQKYLDLYKPKIVKYNVGYFKSEDSSKLFDQLSESKEFNEDTVIFIGHESSKDWGFNFTKGESYPFYWDEEDDAYWVKDNIDSWRPFSIDFFDKNFSKYDYDQTSNMFESEEDELAWAKEVINTPTSTPIVGQVYRINLPEKEKAIIDILITKIVKSEGNTLVYDNTKAIIYDTEGSSMSDYQQTEFLGDYNVNGGHGYLEPVEGLIERGHWILIDWEDSIFNENLNINESEEDEFGWVDDTSSEPFHLTLIRDNDREPMLMDEIHTIMFNPPVSTEDKRFLDIAYWLEDNDYYPETIDYGKKTSYIEMVKQKHQRQSGKWKIGPELTDEELYQLSQTPKRGVGRWNGNFWAEQFYNRFIGKTPKQQWTRVN